MYWTETRKEIIHRYPFLIKGIISKNSCKFQIESLKERFNSGLQKPEWIYKVLYHIIVLIKECEVREVHQVNNINIDTIYVLKNSEDPNIFIAIEDQNQELSKLSNKVKLKVLLSKLGVYFEQKENQNGDYLDFLKQQILDKIFPNQINCIIDQKDILQLLYLVKIIETKYDKNKSAVYIIDKPFYVECDGVEIVVKFLETEAQYNDREIKLLEKVSKCENCTQMFCYSNWQKIQFIFMKKYDITLHDLNNIIGQSCLEEQDFLHLTIQLLLSLQDLHSQGIIHRDLKPENIMFSMVNGEKFTKEKLEIKKLRCVLIDFDRSTIARSMVLEDYVASEYQGTPPYQPPEGTQETYQFSYDIWQMGYIILCLIKKKINEEYSKIIKPIDDSKQYTAAFLDFLTLEKSQEKFKQYLPIIQPMINIVPQERSSLQTTIDQLRAKQQQT